MRGQRNRLSLISLRSAGTAARHEQRPECCWQVSLIRRHESCQHKLLNCFHFLQQRTLCCRGQDRSATVHTPALAGSRSSVAHGHVASRLAQTLQQLWPRVWPVCHTMAAQRRALYLIFFGCLSLTQCPRCLVLLHWSVCENVSLSLLQCIYNLTTPLITDGCVNTQRLNNGLLTDNRSRTARLRNFTMNFTSVPEELLLWAQIFRCQLGFRFQNCEFTVIFII